MDTGTYLTALQADGSALVEAAERVLDERVPPCPDWSAADLLWHVTEVHYFWNEIAARRLSYPRAVEDIERPADGELPGRYREGLARLVETLRDADTTIPVWTWAPRKDIGFIPRRMAQETAVHRWDAEAAAGDTRPIDPRIAVDGVDEYLEYFLRVEPETVGQGETLRLRAAGDGGGRGLGERVEWSVRVDEGGLTANRDGTGAGEPDATVEASPSDLLLLLWRRIGPEVVRVDGDRAALDRFLARAGLT